MTGHARSDWIARARDVKTETVLRDRGILEKLKGRNGKFAGPCPNCCGTDRFAVNLATGVGGAFNCRICGVGGNTAISLVMFLDGVDFLQAVETLAGPPPEAAPTENDDERADRERLAAERRDRIERDRIEREEREAAEAQRTVRYCNDLWAQSKPLPPEAIGYFARRGITLDDVPDQGGLRFHPACPFDGKMVPCIVARFTNAMTNAPGGIWRRPINGAKPKVVGPMKGHIVRLWADDAEVTQGLVIGEGIETTLAAATRITHRGTLLRPAWACGSADNIKEFPVLTGVEHLTIIVDNDQKRAGQNAARLCAKHWTDQGREVELLIPDTIGTDFNDIVMENAS